MTGRLDRTERYSSKTKIIKKLDIYEYRYPNLTASEKKVVKPGLQELAYKLMPEI